jgi:hypothetical protein
VSLISFFLFSIEVAGLQQSVLFLCRGCAPPTPNRSTDPKRDKLLKAFTPQHQSSDRSLEASFGQQQITAIFILTPARRQLHICPAVLLVAARRASKRANGIYQCKDIYSLYPRLSASAKQALVIVPRFLAQFPLMSNSLRMQGQYPAVLQMQRRHYGRSRFFSDSKQVSLRRLRSCLRAVIEGHILVG